jgi:hypothetical protein
MLCPPPGKASERDHNPNQLHRNQPWKSTVYATLALALLVIFVGCASTLKIGSPPRTDQLNTLKLGDSTKPDVLLTLGQPQGDGVVRFADGPTRTIWFYDYMETAGKVMGLKILLVFFDQDKYDGHLWFSSTQELPKAK